MPLPSIHAGLKLDEVVPAPLDQVSGITHSTALVQRKRLRLVPQTSATANPGDIINFLIQDPGMLDLQSAVFHANIVVSGTGGSPSLDDGPAWLRQLVVQVDGQNLETQDRCNKATLMETYMSCEPDLYRRALSFAGFWKFNNELAAFGASSSATNQKQFQDISSNLVAANAFYTTSTYGWDIAVPMGLVSHVFRSDRLFPARFANNLLVQMQLEAATAAIYSGATASTGVNYQLTNIYLNIDSVTLNPAFTAFLQDQVMDPNGSGITLPFNTKITATGQAQANNGENTFVVSRASKNLKRIAVVQQPTAVLGGSATTYAEISTFPSAGFNTRGQSGAVQGQIQLYIAGQYYPLFPARGSDAFFVAVQAYNGHPLVDCGGPIVNYRTWGTTTGTTGGSTVNSGSAPMSDSWIWAYDLSKMVGSSHALEHDGVDSTGNAQIQVTIKTGPSECSTPADGNVSYTPLVEMVGTKYLTIANGELTVMG